MNRILTLALVLGGCASGPPLREVKDTLPRTSDDQARIYFYRTTALGAALRPDIKLNGDVVGESVARGIFFRDVPPGEYVVQTSTEAENRLSLTCEKGQKRYVRFRVQMGMFVGHVIPELVDPVEADTEIWDLAYVAPAAVPAAAQK